MNPYHKLKVKVLDHMEYLKFDREHPWHRNMICLYCSVIEYSDSLIHLDKEKRSVAIPLVARALLEAYVDLKNLCENEEYGYNLEAGFLFEWLRVTKEAGRLNNPYLDGLAASDGFEDQVTQWEERLQELKDRGNANLNQFDKFKLADMENEYRSVYNSLCSYSHNNIRALIDRYIEVNDDQTDFKVVMFKDQADDENENYLDLGQGCLNKASYLIHDKLETGYAKVFNDI
jgi:hypothetical protein